MKSVSKTLLAMSLGTVLALPALAQDPNQGTSSSAPQPQTQSQPAPDTTAQSNSTATAHEPLQLETKQGFWGKINPFARKKYVQKQMTPVVGRVNELDELTNQNAKQIKDVDSRASEGIRLASVKVNEADSHAIDAGNKATQAHQTAEQANQRLTTITNAVENIDQYQMLQETEIRFRPGQNVLSKKAKDALDELAQPLKSQKGYVVEVQGFSSGRGAEAIENSRRMAESVVRYLVIEHEVPVYRIHTIGMGNVAPKPAADGSKPRRINGGRVEIALLKNNLGDLESAQNTAAGTSQQPTANQALPQSDQPVDKTKAAPEKPKSEQEKPKTEEPK